MASGGASSGTGGSVSSAGQAGGSAGARAQGTAGAQANPPLDITFFVVADTHADPVLEDDLLATARTVNAVAANGTWPSQIGGQDTHFKGGPIGKPRGVAFVGDLTGWGTAPTELPSFRHYFEAGNSADSITFPSYLGLGNHDIDTADRSPDLATQYRSLEWGYVDSRHKGPSAAVPVSNFDAASHAYSYDFAGVHLVQVHRFSGDVEYGLSSSLSWLADDLKKYASDGRPVILLHHYGMDAFGTGTNPLWWTDADRTAYRNTLKGYHISAVIVGHSHAAFNYSWEGLRVFQVNNAKAEIGTGNNDGNGSFAIVRITADQMDIVTCRWLDTAGNYELIGPYFSGPTDPGAAP
jgi:cytolysin (calcineurin-like family phosphatase)